MMTLEKAELIIKTYGMIMSQSQQHLFQDKRILPFSSSLVKFSIYRYLVELKRREELNMTQIENMIVAYAHLSYFVDAKDAEVLNKIILHKNSKSVEIIQLITDNANLIHAVNYYKDQLTTEIKEYIIDLMDYVKN